MLPFREVCQSGNAVTAPFVFRGGAGQRFVTSLAVVVGAVSQGGLMVWSLKKDPIALGGALFSIAAMLGFLWVAVRSMKAEVVVTSRSIELIGLVRTHKFDWVLVDDLEIGAYFGGPALFVTLKSSGRQVLPLIVQRQRRRDLEALRTLLLESRVALGAPEGDGIGI